MANPGSANIRAVEITIRGCKITTQGCKFTTMGCEVTIRVLGFFKVLGFFGVQGLTLDPLFSSLKTSKP
jgi:hypothetical protein